MIAPEHFGSEPVNNQPIADAEGAEERLAAQIGTVPWRYLLPHCRNGVLLYVDPALPLAEVGAAIARNESPRVEAWLRSGDLVKLGELHAGQWENDAPEFEALVVSPFVLCRPAGGAESA
jgi:hypothetical protein